MTGARGTLSYAGAVNGLRAGLWTGLYAVGRTLDRAATAVFYAAAGALRLEELRRAIQREWQEAGDSEPDTYIASGLMRWEEEFYSRCLKPDDRVLVVGCGTGRDLLALLERGYRAEGLDVVPQCTATARRILQERGHVAPVYTGAIEAIPLPGSFDAFIFSWFCYGYIPQADTRIGALRKVKAHSNPGGRILISYIPAGRPPRALPIRLTQLVTRLTGSDWHPEPGDVIGPAAGDRQRLHYEHRFREGEFENEACAAGLTVVFHERRDEGTAVLMVY